MEKRKGVDVFKAFDDYSDRECDLLNNPKYECSEPQMLDRGVGQ